MFALLSSGCASLPENSDKSISHSYQHKTEDFKPYFLAGSKALQNKQNAFYLLGDGLNAFVARALLARTARHSIDLQYYMIHGDEVGRLFSYQVLEAANRGVKVRILLDDIDEGGRDLRLATFDQHPNVEIRIFNPFGRNVSRTFQYVTGFGKQTRRAHNKSFTVDNIATVIGGRNIGNEYFSDDPELEFQDLDVIAIGPVANQVSTSFDLYWNHKLSYPISTLLDESISQPDLDNIKQVLAEYVANNQNSVYLQSLRDSKLAKQYRNKNIPYSLGEAVVYADPPDKLTYSTAESDDFLIQQLLPYMNLAKQELIIISPYFVPGKKGVEILRKLANRGVRIRILTNSLSSTDVSIVHAGYSRYRKKLLQAGIELYELNKKTSKQDRHARSEGIIGSSKSSLHAKAFVVDRKLSYIGSLNLDPRSIIQNTEIGMIIESAEIATQIATHFNANIDTAAFKVELQNKANGSGSLLWRGQENGRTVEFNKEPYTSFWRRLSTSLLKWLPIESQI